eukprot:259052-Prymnesium_polylepis.2
MAVRHRVGCAERLDSGPRTSECLHTSPRGAVEPRPVSERGVPYEDTGLCGLCGHFRFGPADGGLAPPLR